MTLKEKMQEKRKDDLQEVKKKICEIFSQAQEAEKWDKIFVAKLYWRGVYTDVYVLECQLVEPMECKVVELIRLIERKNERKEIIDYLKKELEREGIDVTPIEEKKNVDFNLTVQLS